MLDVAGWNVKKSVGKFFNIPIATCKREAIELRSKKKFGQVLAQYKKSIIFAP